MSCPWRRIGCLTLLFACLAACQPWGSKTSPPPSEPQLVVEPIASPTPILGIDWTRAPDCRGMLALLKAGLDEGRIVDLGETPFMLIHEQPSAAGMRWRPFGRHGGQTIDRAPSSPEARCVLRVGEAGERKSDHRVLGREQVRSRYQSGTRVEKNPAYDVAKARLRQAEKAAKPGKSSIVKVGDPLIDLVGTLVGGALTGLGRWGSGDQLEEALDTLMATPPSIEHPKYKDYHFERARIRASREATLPVLLTDRQLQRSWQASLKRREHRELFLVKGLDRQDQDYARQSQNSLTEDGLRQWLAEVPSLPLADMVAVLLDRPSTAPIDRLAFDDLREDRMRAASQADGGFVDAAALPPPGLVAARHEAVVEAASDRDPSVSRITVIGETVRAEGIYIAPHFILTPSTVVGARGLVDVEEGPGRMALGLVAAVDHGLGLALIHAPAPGRPVAVGERRPKAGSLSGHGVGRLSPASTPGSPENAPLLVDGRLVGFKTDRGPDIDGDAIQVFLERQDHLLPIDHR